MDAAIANNAGKAFEADVDSILQLLGYVTTRNAEIDGNDIDIYAELVSGLCRQRVAVECKDRSHNLTVKEVGEFCAVFLSLRAKNKVDMGIIVARQGFTPNARANAQSAGVLCLTHTELLGRLLDFTSYLRKFVSDYEHYDEYAQGQRKPIVEIMQRCNLFRLYVDLRCFDLHGKVYNRIDDYVEDWLKHPERSHLSILGDYGTGKSSFCLQLTYKLAKQYLDDPVINRIPLFISLRDYASAVNVQQLVTDLLLNQYGIPLPNYVVFQKVLESGRLILILDGFDEMATKVDKRITLRNFEELCRLVVANSKTILTCRTHYFKSHTHALELLSTSEQTELMKSVMGRPNFEIIELLEFDEHQIKEMLGRYTDKRDEYWNHVQRTYNLEDLARRPILLDMILKTLPQLVATGREVDAALLYEEYTRFWIEREDWHSVMTKEGKAAFMEELANLMYKNDGREWISYRDLPKPIKEQFRHEILTSEDLDYYDHDTRACSFLNRDRKGNYKFIHRSFMEFFVAKRIVRQIEEGRSLSIRDEMLPPVISGFMQRLLRRRDKLWEMIESTRGKAFEQTKYVGANAASILNQMGESFAGKDLSRTVLRGADLSGANMEAARLVGADLEDVAFDYALLRQTNSANANLKGATFSDTATIHSIAISPEGNRIAVGGGMGNVGIFRIADAALERNLKLPTGAFKLCFNPQGSCLALGDSRGRLVIFDLTVRREVFATDVHKGKISSIIYSPDGNQLALASEDGYCRVVDIKKREVILDLRGGGRCMNVVSYSQDGRLLAVGGDDLCLKIWDVRSGNPIQEIPLDHACWAICFSPDSTSLFEAGGSDPSGGFPISVWDWNKGRQIARVYAHGQVVYGMRAFSELNRVMTWSQDGSVMVWRVGDPQPSLVFRSDAPLWAGDLSRINDVVAGGNYNGRLIAFSLRDSCRVCDFSTTMSCTGMNIRGVKGLSNEAAAFLNRRGAVS